MMYLSHKKKVLLSAAVLFALASGEALQVPIMAEHRT